MCFSSDYLKPHASMKSQDPRRWLQPPRVSAEVGVSQELCPQSQLFMPFMEILCSSYSKALPESTGHIKHLVFDSSKDQNFSEDSLHYFQLGKSVETCH